MGSSLFAVQSASIKLQCFHKHLRTQEANLIFYTIMSIKKALEDLPSCAGGTEHHQYGERHVTIPAILGILGFYYSSAIFVFLSYSFQS